MIKKIVTKIVADALLAEKVVSEKLITDELTVNRPKKETRMIYITFGIYLLTLILGIVYINYRPGIVSITNSVDSIKTNQDSLKSSNNTILLAVQNLTGIVSKQQDVISHSPIGKPLDIQNMKNVTSTFGPRINNKGDTTYHKAIDISAPKGSPLYAMASGTVMESRYANGWGNTVVVNCGTYGYSYRISHMDKILVAKGQEVTQGEQIGTVGNTGNSFGYHADIRITFVVDGKEISVDPSVFI
jgi:murein DD-endopeptidase MepM/ murein hydrolase activator NlpD